MATLARVLNMFYKVSWRRKDGALTLCHLSIARHRGYPMLCGVQIPEDIDEAELEQEGALCARCYNVAKRQADDGMANRHLNDWGNW